MPVTDHVVALFESCGIETVFGFPCEQFEPYYASLADSDVRHVLARSEASAAIMADGYARASNSVGVCDGVGGPGAAYTAVGLVEAAGASSPVLALTGDNDRAFRGNEAIQDAPNVEMLAPHVDAGYDPESPARAVEAVRNAIREAVTGVPGPTHVNLTEDVLAAEFDGDPPSAPTSTVPAARPAPDDGAVDEAVRVLADAERPVVVAGEGAIRSRAHEEIAALARRMGAPVVTSMNGKGAVAETAPFAAGVAGRWGFSRPANDALRGADTVLALGCRLGELTTVGWTLVADDADVVHVDLDPHWLGRTYDGAVGLLADVRAAADALLDRLDGDDFPDADARIDALAEERADWWASHADELDADREPISPARLVAEIRDAIPPASVLVSATSFPGFFTGAFYEVREPGVRYLQARGSDGINYALPQALGVQVARPDEPVVVATGDGGVGYHVADLETAAREDLPVTVVVFDNGMLGSSKASQVANWNVDLSTDFHPDVDYATVARGLGCEGAVVEDPGELVDVLGSAVESDDPWLLDVKVDPWVAPPVLTE